MNTHLKTIGTLFVISLTLFGCGLPSPIQPQDKPLAIDSPIVEPPAEEPSTTPSAEDSIKKLFSEKYNKPISEINVIITSEDDTHIRGGVSFSPGGPEDNGIFLAVKENNQWKLVYDGNGSAPCAELIEYGFIQDFLKGICDPEPVAKPITETPNETMVVRVYFNNPDIDPNWDTECNNVFAVERNIPLTRSVALATMTELLKGPTDTEKNNGYVTNINTGVKVQKLTIENGVAKIDFDERLEYQVGGSCKTSAIIAQIKQTLKQFSTVKDVVISINGETEAILQP